MKYKALISILFFAALGAALIPASQVVASPYNQNNIIDDQVFDDTTTMSAAQIDGFLNTFPNSCISPNSGFKAIDPTGYSPSGGYTYGGYVTAGQVISDAAQAYGLNPQVLITTLEKEQSLVTGQNNFSGYCNNGDQHKYAAAVGYGCPDSGTTYSYTGLDLYQRNGTTISNVGPTCVNTSLKAGFSQQVIRAAWLFKFGEQRSKGNIGWAVIKGNWNNSDDPQTCYGGPMTQGTYQRCPSGAAAYYDGYTTIDSTSVHIDDGATAALYWYTPHFHGNQIFASLFESWFGSLIGSYLVRTTEDATVYLISGTSKYPIADSSVLNDFSPLGYVKYVSDAYVGSYTTGPTLGHMVGGSDGTIYYVNAGIKLAFPSCSMVTDYGYSCSSVITLDSTQLNKLASGPGVTSVYTTTSGKTFYISSGTKREVFDQQSLNQAGINPASNTLLEAGISYLPYGLPVIRNGVLVTSRATNQHYLYDSSRFFQLPDDINGLGAVKNLPKNSLDDDSITPAQRTTNFNGYVASTDNTKKYILLNDGKGQLTSPAIWASTYTTVSNDLLTLLPDSAAPINNGLVKSASNGTVYDVVNGQKRPIPSWNDLINLHATPFGINVLTDTSLSQLATGIYMYGPGRLVKVASSGTVYIVKSASEMFPISSFIYPQELGLGNGVVTISNSDLQAYTILPALTSKIQCNAVNYVGISGQIFALDTNLMTTYGFSNSDFVDAGSICANLQISAKQLSSFIRVGNGTIYYVTNGQKQPISSYNTYVAKGGNSGNTVQVSDYFASLIVTGQTL